MSVERWGLPIVFLGAAIILGWFLWLRGPSDAGPSQEELQAKREEFEARRSDYRRFCIRTQGSDR